MNSSRSTDELEILTTEKLNVSLMPGALWVGRVLPDGLQSCAWPLLKCLMSSSTSTSGRAGFFSFTQDDEELTLIMDDWCNSVFREAGSVAAISYGPRRWRAFELRLGTLAWEVPGVVSFLSSVMAESDISILKVASYDRDFLLVQESDVAQASTIIQASFKFGPLSVSYPFSLHATSSNSSRPEITPRARAGHRHRRHRFRRRCRCHCCRCHHR